MVQSHVNTAGGEVFRSRRSLLPLVRSVSSNPEHCRDGAHFQELFSPVFLDVFTRFG